MIRTMTSPSSHLLSMQTMNPQKKSLMCRMMMTEVSVTEA